MRRRVKFILLSLRGVLLTVLLLVATAVSGVLLINWVQPREPLRAALQDALARFLERPVSVDAVEWGFTPPGLLARDVRVYESDGREMAHSPKVRLSLGMRAFLKRKTLDVDQVTFLSPRILLRRRADGDADLERMVRQVHGRMREGRSMGKGLFPVEFHHFAIRGGRVVLMDERLQADPLPVSLSVDADGDLKAVEGERSFPFILNGRASGGGVSGPFSMTGRLGSGDGVRVASPGLPLALLADKAPFFKAWKGNVVFSGRWDIGEGNADITGTLADARPSTGPVTMRLSGNFRFLKRSTSTASLSLTDEGTDARLEITAAPWDQRRAWVVFTSSSADVNRLVDAWHGLRPQEPSVSTGTVVSAAAPAAPPAKDLWTVETKVDVRDAVFRGESLRQLSFSVLRNDRGEFAVRDVTAEAFGGRLLGGATFYYLPGQKPRSFAMPPQFRLSWQLEGLDIARFSETFQIKKVFSGSGSAAGTLTGPWPVEDWTRMDGNVSFDVRDGVVWGLPGMVAAFSHLNITSLFSKKAENGGMPFRHATGRFEMGGGNLHFDVPARFENKTLEMAFAGTIDVAGQKVDAALVLHFLTFMGEVIRAVPGLGSVLMAGRKSLFPVVVRVTGPLSAPTFDYQAARSLLAPFWTPFRRPSTPEETVPAAAQEPL